jgi:hypothetical protein
VKTISKSSLFLGATAAAGSSVTGPIPAGGPAPVTGLSTILRISDAIFTPLAARQVVEARRAGLRMATNDALLGVAEAYVDFQASAGRVTIRPRSCVICHIICLPFCHAICHHAAPLLK